MDELEDVLDRLEALLTDVEVFDTPTRERFLELVDNLDALHRFALRRLGDALDPGQIDRLHDADPAIAWLFDAYGVATDDVTADTPGRRRP